MYSKVRTLVLMLCFAIGLLFATRTDGRTIQEQLTLATPAVLVTSQVNSERFTQQATDLYGKGQFAQAIAVWQQAVAAYKTAGDNLNQAMALSNLSLTYQQQGEWSNARDAIATSLKLLQPKPSQNSTPEQLKILAGALDIQGRLQLSLGQAETAFATWQQTEKLYTKLGDRTGTLQSQLNQAQALQSAGLYRKAASLLSQQQPSLQNQPNSTLKATGLRSYGNLLRLVGDLSESQQALQQSLDIARTIRSTPDISAALLSLGNTTRAQQNPKTALTYYQQSSTTATGITQVQAHLNQLSLLIEMKQWQPAQALLPQIQPKLDALPLSRTSITARIQLALSLMKLGDRVANAKTQAAQLLSTAVQHAKQFADPRTEAYALGSLGRLYEQNQQVSDAQTLTQQALLLSQSLNAPDLAYQWHWQMGRLLNAQGDTPGAIAAYEASWKLLQTIRNDLVAVNPDVQFSFRESVEPVYRELAELLLQDSDPKPTSAARFLPTSPQNLLKARNIIESLQLAELDNFFRQACIETQKQLDQIIDQRDRTAAVLYPIILPNRIDVLLKLPGQPLQHYSTAIAQAEAEKTIDQLWRDLGRPYTLRNVQTESQTIYQWLLKPAEAGLRQNKVKTLVFVLDGSLRRIPMAALYDGQQFLVQTYNIAVTPGFQLFEPTPLQQRKLQVLAAGLSENRFEFGALPNVKQELTDIQTEVSSRVLLNQSFTSQALRQEINTLPFPVVHLATHGQFSSNAEKTFILAWDRPINVTELDTYLRPRGQAGTTPIELLVLSACETATGDRRSALGIAGVAIRAGARSTLASLWNLNDESTALLMAQFYRELRETPITKAEALRRAQLSLLNNPNYQHPIYWAPFILVGNWL
jgi:CHAT domain-containing protein